MTNKIMRNEAGIRVLQHQEIAIHISEKQLADLVTQTLSSLDGMVQRPWTKNGLATDFILTDDVSVAGSGLARSNRKSVILLHSGNTPPPELPDAQLTYVNIDPAGHRALIRKQLITALRLPYVDPTRQLPVICLGASTGGVDALIVVLRHLRSVSCPILIVQHTSPDHFLSLIRVLKEQTGLTIKPGDDGLELQENGVYLASDTDADMVVLPTAPSRLGRKPEKSVCFHTPSIDGLFRSASLLGRRAIGVLLTGMGRDGAAGLRDMHLAGAFTIVQDAETSVVYGMPKVAFETGAANKRLPLEEIGPQIVDYLQEAHSLSVGTDPCKHR